VLLAGVVLDVLEDVEGALSCPNNAHANSPTATRERKRTNGLRKVDLLFEALVQSNLCGASARIRTHKLTFRGLFGNHLHGYATRLALPIHATHRVNDGWKILRAERPVQLIVFFAPIREILKKEIYGRDKEFFLNGENKGPGTMEVCNDITNLECS
jgi:hypothetical protein